VDVLRAELSAQPGGISGAAKRIGRSPGVLHNKFSEAMPHYEITVREALALADGVPETSFPEVVAEHFEGVFFRLPQGAQGDDDLLASYLAIGEQLGDLSREFTEARADGIIEPGEFAVLKLRSRRLIAAVMRMESDLQGMVRDVPSPQPVVALARREIDG
jgi:hypothetical protein